MFFHSTANSEPIFDLTGELAQHVQTSRPAPEALVSNDTIPIHANALHICHGGLILKTSSKIFATLACLVVLAGTLQAQETSSGMVAVLDVAKVFEDNIVFNQRMEAIKTEAEQFKAKMEAEQETIRREAERLNEYTPDSTEFKQLESQLEQRTATLRTTARQTNTAMLNREAKIYYDTYTQMQEILATVAGEYNITLIIRFDSGAIDATNRGEVVKGVNRNVVFQKNLDLTNMVIERMGSVSSAGVGGQIR
jgi:Skp family chaperone for outer membrane proteins